MCGCDSVIEMEKAGRITGKHEELCLGQFTFEMHIRRPRGVADCLILESGEWS